MSSVSSARSRALLVLSLVSGLCALPAFGQQRPLPKRHAAPAGRTAGRVKPLAEHPRVIPNRYVMVLADAPVLAQYRTAEEAATAQGKAYRAQIETRQQAMIQTLQARHIQVTSRVSGVLNALFVVAPGQSGHVMSPLARNFVQRWRDGAMIMITARPDTVAVRLTLSPGGPT